MESNLAEPAGRRKTQETRSRILDAAEDVFNESGYSQTTLNEIAERAGVTRGAIYWHFKNKEDLFQAMCQRVRRPMDSLIEQIVETTGEDDPIKLMIGAHEFIMAEVIRNPHYRKVLSILFLKCEYTRDTDQIVIQQKEWRNYSRGVVRKILVRAQESGKMPKDLDIELAGNVFGFVFKGLLTDWLFIPESFDLIEVGHRVSNAIFEMLEYSPYLRKNFKNK